MEIPGNSPHSHEQVHWPDEGVIEAPAVLFRSAIAWSLMGSLRSGMGGLRSGARPADNSVLECPKLDRGQLALITGSSALEVQASSVQQSEQGRVINLGVVSPVHRNPAAMQFIDTGPLDCVSQSRGNYIGFQRQHLLIVHGNHC